MGFKICQSALKRSFTIICIFSIFILTFFYCFTEVLNFQKFSTSKQSLRYFPFVNLNLNELNENKLLDNKNQFFKTDSTNAQSSTQIATAVGCNRTKIILVWYVPFGVSSDMILRYSFDEPETRGSNINIVNSKFELKMDTNFCGKCLITYDRQKLEKSDAIVFHSTDIRQSTLPSTRKPNQYYVWWLQESSANYGASKNLLNDYFNLTMFVRRSSDIYSPYLTFPFLLKMLWQKNKGIHGFFPESRVSEKDLKLIISKLPTSSMAHIYDIIPSSLSENTAQLLRKKDRMVVWISSNCKALLRMNFYKLLKAGGLNIDLYGNCGQNTFPIKSRNDERFFEVISKYKFYLAMENSFHCKDYLTEKLWLNSLYSGTVPVIFGPHPDDVAAVLPPKSYIHVEDFSDHHELIRYLQYLDRNATAYAEYLQWRDLVDYLDENGNYNPGAAAQTPNITPKQLDTLNRFGKPIANGFCGLCKKLHDGINVDKKTVDIQRMIRDDRPECSNNRLADRFIPH